MRDLQLFVTVAVFVLSGCRREPDCGSHLVYDRTARACVCPVGERADPDGGVCIVADACTPGAEVCNGRDDDCDSNIDERAASSCGSVGVDHVIAWDCIAGACEAECASGYGDCDEDATGGCESRLASDPRHCGGCYSVCERDQACVASSCAALPIVEWARSGGGPGFDDIRAVARSSDGNIYAFGSVSAGAAFEGEAVLVSAQADLLMLGYSAEGDLRFARTAGGPGVEVVSDAATDEAGNVYLIGTFTSPFRFVGGSTLPLVGSTDVFVASLSPAGFHRWSISFGSAGVDRAWSIAAADGDVLIASEVAGAVVVGGRAGTFSGGKDALIASFDATTGANRWGTMFGGTGDELAMSVAIPRSGVAYVSGLFSGTTHIGTTVAVAGGAWDAFIARADEGEWTWVRTYGGDGEDGAHEIALDPSSEDVLVAGAFTGSVSLGGPPLDARGSYDIFLARYDADGEHLWSRGFGGSDFERPNDLAIIGDRIALGGQFAGVVDLGSGPLSSTGTRENTFVAVFDPGGVGVWSRSFTMFSGRVIDVSLAGGDSELAVGGAFVGSHGLTSDIQIGPAASEDAFVFLMRVR